MKTIAPKKSKPVATAKTAPPVAPALHTTPKSHGGADTRNYSVGKSQRAE